MYDFSLDSPLVSHWTAEEKHYAETFCKCLVLNLMFRAHKKTTNFSSLNSSDFRSGGDQGIDVWISGCGMAIIYCCLAEIPTNFVLGKISKSPRQIYFLIFSFGVTPSSWATTNWI